MDDNLPMWRVSFNPSVHVLPPSFERRNHRRKRCCLRMQARPCDVNHVGIGVGAAMLPGWRKWFAYRREGPQENTAVGGFSKRRRRRRQNTRVRMGLEHQSRLEPAATKWPMRRLSFRRTIWDQGYWHRGVIAGLGRADACFRTGDTRTDLSDANVERVTTVAIKLRRSNRKTRARLRKARVGEKRVTHTPGEENGTKRTNGIAQLV